MRIARFAIAAIAATAISGAAAAESFIRCQSPAGDPITIELGANEMLGRTVGCIGGSFVADMTPCAPDGEYGLSAPTGTASLVEIVSRWQDYGDHSGGVASHFVTPTEIYFTGGHTFPGSGYTPGWSFSVDRLTGEGTLALEDGVAAVYECVAAARKF